MKFILWWLGCCAFILLCCGTYHLFDVYHQTDLMWEILGVAAVGWALAALVGMMYRDLKQDGEYIKQHKEQEQAELLRKNIIIVKHESQ